SLGLRLSVAAEYQRVVMVVIDAGKPGQAVSGTWHSRAPAEHVPVDVVDAHRQLPFVGTRPFRDPHVHAGRAGVRVQADGAFVDLPAHELEGEAHLGNPEPGGTAAGNGLPNPLQVFQMSASR